jgi:hypothetical protein
VLPPELTPPSGRGARFGTHDPPKHELPMMQDDGPVHGVRHTLSVESALSAHSAAVASDDAHVAVALALRQSDEVEQGSVHVPQMHRSVPPHDASSLQRASQWVSLPLLFPGRESSSQPGAHSIPRMTSVPSL